MKKLLIRIFGLTAVALSLQSCQSVQPQLGAGANDKTCNFPGRSQETITPWEMKKLSRPPEFSPAEGFEVDGLKAIYYEGLVWQGKPTRVFALYGIPPSEPGRKLPAMVLAHGGGGTAFADWVRLWNSRGYAAIAMDTCGCVPKGVYGNWQRHDQGGPPGWGGLDQIDWPTEDQWTYHAVADVILAHSLIRSFPEVDPDRIGLTGISWGGYLTCITAGIDPRFKCAIPVYGCGFLGDNSVWLPEFTKIGEEKTRKWLGLWDPSNYLPRVNAPMLWVTGTNDFAYPMDSLQKSYRLLKTSRSLCIRIEMGHGHGPVGEGPEEIHAFANSFLKDGGPLLSIIRQSRKGNKIAVEIADGARVETAELIWTSDSGNWKERKWRSSPAELNHAKGCVTASLPKEAMVYYINLIDDKGNVTSSEHVEVLPH